MVKSVLNIYIYIYMKCHWFSNWELALVKSVLDNIYIYMKCHRFLNWELALVKSVLGQNLCIRIYNLRILLSFKLGVSVGYFRGLLRKVDIRSSTLFKTCEFYFIYLHIPPVACSRLCSRDSA